MLGISPIISGSQPPPPQRNTAEPEDQSDGPAKADEPSGTSVSGSNATTEPESAPEQSSAPAATSPAPVQIIKTEQIKETEVLDTSAARAAAERRIEAQQTRALIDSIAPVEVSPEKASSSYVKTLMQSGSLEQPSLATSSDDVKTDPVN